MKVECINDNWFMDMETGKTGLSFKRGKAYELLPPQNGGIESEGDFIVLNEQGSRHIIKTKDGLSDFFNRYFRLVQS